jgi:Flp pilus assembly protein TadB
MKKFLGMYWSEDEFIVPMSIRVTIILLAMLMAVLFIPMLLIVYIFVVFGIFCYLWYINTQRKKDVE